MKRISIATLLFIHASCLGPQVERLARIVPKYSENLFEILRREQKPENRQTAANLLSHGERSIRYLADNSVLFNVQGPARELLDLIDPLASGRTGSS